ncbi:MULTISPECIES: LysR family transcriptional regulator [unclassified Pyramidobacter]|uniref:LysR family transcriptional regulator n=1 Tax=unclassified Pyramidobacter TaxID=2632171 RepID=UPI0009900DFE|nr:MULTISPECIES: LysR family transcriptional regulator [unclassified Pyramidobacter]MCI7402935.1 LysR family transcriptional regulator [Pyramidobacter sp.]MDY3212325.1 LysR family transcriptional regulator [Pyramidobacter sp.]OON88701.1 hypothetical protein B0D78_07370 [Pyramidobacter sp. C12-8]WOL40760.1 LysR family transcriptional regulator [Pyramidobacter sp. YE332]
MLNNYNYFITLAEEKNISRAAERLFISHQCLSKYLKNLEQEYRVTFFERSPRLKLTVAGEAMLNMLRQVQFLERNLESQLDDIRQSRRGIIRLGTTEGRYRILFPDLLSQFKKIYPDVLLEVSYATSEQLTESVLKNELDIVLMNKSFVNRSQLTVQPLLDERIYLVISDNMLEQYFPERYPECRELFAAEGADLKMFQHVPFILNRKSFNSRIMLDSYLQAHNLHLNCVMELTQLDLHFMMSARDYAASFCWSMYIPLIRRMNRADPERHLNVFPVKGVEALNHMVLVTQEGKILPEYGRELIEVIKRNCAGFEK